MRGRTMRRGWPLLLLLTASAGTAAERPPELLPRTGKWLVDYADNSCNLATTFGSKKEEVVLRMTRVAPGDAQEITLYGQRFKTQEVSARAVIRFEPGGLEQSASTLSGTSGKVPMLRLGTFRFDGVRQDEADGRKQFDPAVEAALQRLVVKRNGRVLALDIHGIAAALKALRTCTDDLIRHWGYDPAVQASLQRDVEPISPPSRWFSSNDYPQKALANGESALLTVRLDVDPAGSVTGCNVLTRTKGEDFAEVTCSILRRRARLRPALESTGSPVKSFFIANFIYMMG